MAEVCKHPFQSHVNHFPVTYNNKVAYQLSWSLSVDPLYILMEYAVHGSLKDFLHDCDIVVKKLNMAPHVARFRKHAPSMRTCSSVSSTYPLLVDKTPLSAQNSVFTPADTPTTASKGDRFEFPLTATHQHKMRERFVTQDSGFFSDTNSVDAHHMACVKDGTSTPVAHTVVPLSHDYINSKGLIYMEDVQNFALQIACGLQHLEDIGVGLYVCGCVTVCRIIIMKILFISNRLYTVI